jgi:hypothetical protein
MYSQFTGKLSILMNIGLFVDLGSEIESKRLETAV